MLILYDIVFILNPSCYVYWSTNAFLKWALEHQWSFADQSTAGVVKTPMTHWGRMMHICVSKLTIICSDNGLTPDQHQAIIWTNTGILLIGPLGTNFSEILIDTYTLLFKKMHLKMSSRKWRPFCLGLNVLSQCQVITIYHLMYAHVYVGIHVLKSLQFISRCPLDVHVMTSS